MVLDVEPGRRSAAAREVSADAFRILVVGDFAGAGRVRQQDRAIEVDRDNLDDVMAALRPSVRFTLGGANGPDIGVDFSTLDDFHPDRLLHSVPLLQSLVELRSQAREGRLDSGPAETAPGPVPRPAAASAPSAAQPGGGSLLDQILEETAGPAPASSAPTAARPAPGPAPNDLHAFIRSALAPHRVRADDPRQVALTAQVEDTMAAVVRGILHQPEFQALEAAWRGLSLLVRRLETGARLKVYVLDMPRAAFTADLAAARADSVLHRVIGGARESGVSWAVISALYTFDGTATDAAQLSAIGTLAREAGAPFIAAAAPGLGGVASFDVEPDLTELQFTVDAAWSQLRAGPAAPYLGLLLPRVLLRAPYDPREEPCEEIALEEMNARPSHEDYLWGNPSLAAALLLGEAFDRSGWDMRPGDMLEIGGLPLHLYRDEFATVAKPCAETLLTDRVAVRIMQQGLMPLLSQKNGDAIRLVSFQSIAEPASALAGPWAEAT